jgi:hypothetical protein
MVYNIAISKFSGGVFSLKRRGDVTVVDQDTSGRNAKSIFGNI